MVLNHAIVQSKAIASFCGYARLHDVNMTSRWYLLFRYIAADVFTVVATCGSDSSLATYHLGSNRALAPYHQKKFFLDQTFETITCHNSSINNQQVSFFGFNLWIVPRDVATVLPGTMSANSTLGLKWPNSSANGTPIDLNTYIASQLGPKRILDFSVLIVLTIIYLVIFTTGLIGNAFTCLVVIKNQYMQTATNFYLFNLAVADMITLVFGKYISLPVNMSTSFIPKSKCFLFYKYYSRIFEAWKFPHWVFDIWIR